MNGIKWILITTSIFLLPSALQSQPTGKKGKTYVVSVGISDYNCLNDLRLSAHDARSIAQLYKKRGAIVKLLTDANDTKSHVLALIQNTFAKAKKEDMIVLFFSGHGFPDGFCTYDTNCSYGKYITYEELKRLYSQSASERKLIFADACYSGSFRGEKKRKTASHSFSDQHLLLFLSSRTDETSTERTDMKNGYFTTFLLAGLQGEGDVNRDNRVTAKELYTYVREKVVQISFDRQHPVMWGKFSNNLILMNHK